MNVDLLLTKKDEDQRKGRVTEMAWFEKQIFVRIVSIAKFCFNPLLLVLGTPLKRF